MKSNYFTVDKEKIERRNAERDYKLSYHDLLDPDRKNERKNMIKFLKENEVLLYDSMYPSDIDYEGFVGCMEIYNKIGVNYFYDFLYLRIDHQNMNLGKGIKYYNNFTKQLFDDDYLNSYLQEVSKTIKLMKFFGIENLYGTTIEQYIDYYNNADGDLYEMRQKELHNRKLNEQESLKQIKDRYFNFDNFNNVKFENIFNECLGNIKMKKNIYTLDEVINMNTSLDDNKTFIVFLIRNNNICFIGRSKDLLNYIGVKNKKYMVDSICFYDIDDDYIDDIYVKALLAFDVGIGCTIKHTNKKYITLKSVKRIFKEIYKINLVHIKKIISLYNIEIFMIDDVVFVDKIELDRATREYLGLNAK